MRGFLCLALLGLASAVRQHIKDDSVRAPEFKLGDLDSDTCPEGYTKLTVSQCEAAAAELPYSYEGTRDKKKYPSGCYFKEGKTFIKFNTNTGIASSEVQPVCGRGLEPAPAPTPALEPAPTPPVASQEFIRGELGEDTCPSGYHKIRTPLECDEASVVLKLKYKGLKDQGASSVPNGCYLKGDGISTRFNTHHKGSPNAIMWPVCRSSSFSSTGFIVGTVGEDCPSDFKKLTVSECEEASGKIGYAYNGTRDKEANPTGCYVAPESERGFKFNNHLTGSLNVKFAPVCR